MLDENNIDVGVYIKNVMPLFSFRNKRKQQNSDEKEPEPDSDDKDEDLVDSSDEEDITSIKHIHKVLNLETIEERANNLFVKFLTNKSKIETIAKEIQEYKLSKDINANVIKSNCKSFYSNQTHLS
ncbi:hypothetical protein BpHYR1_015186 [Brachionus plicatilis]|uniref:Uncharacterized protein n=1 Tax=Brachionus plicatilis TaxID=10195 RepID=A0A3M7PWK4_BRAPC|nr:hypothetical protein BpHYR1_015186 [Brachionus plicatilis]